MLLDAAGGEELPLLPAVWRPEGFELLVRSQPSLGGRDSAARAAARARALADALGLRPAAAMADRAAAAVALDAGEPAVAAELALRAADTADAVGAPVEAALSRMLGGRALAQASNVERATAELERAATRFEDCGALRRRDEAERELGRIGRRRHRRTRRGAAEAGGIESLTEREMQVARLIVDRRTNAEIAGELFPRRSEWPMARRSDGASPALGREPAEPSTRRRVLLIDVRSTQRASRRRRRRIAR